MTVASAAVRCYKLDYTPGAKWIPENVKHNVVFDEYDAAARETFGISYHHLVRSDGQYAHLSDMIFDRICELAKGIGESNSQEDESGVSGTDFTPYREVAP